MIPKLHRPVLARASLAVAIIALFLVASLATPAGHVVADEIPLQCPETNTDVGDLIDAIVLANSNGNGLDIIRYAEPCELIFEEPHSYYNGFNALPLVTEPLEIVGPVQLERLLSAEDEFRLLAAVAPLTLRQVRIVNGFGRPGGGVYAESTLLLEDSEFFRNNASAGGAVFVDSRLSILRGSFDTNEALTDFGGAIAASGPVNVDGTSFRDNRALTDGGALHALDGANLFRAIFKDNKTLQGNGGGAYIEGAAIVTRSTFLDDEATAMGGAIYVTGPGATIVHESTFIGERAASGGAIAAHNALMVTDSTLVGNQTLSGEGGAVYAASESSISRSQLNFNRAGGLGGAIYALKHVDLEFNAMWRNEGKVGGALHAHETARVTRNLFHDNLAEIGQAVSIDQLQGGLSEVINNVVSYATKAAAQAICLLCDESSSGEALVYNNTLVQNGEALDSALEFRAGTVTAQHNIITGFAAGLHAGGATVDSSFNLYFANTADETGGIAPSDTHITGQSPAFRGPDYHDYRLRADSPAVDKALGSLLAKMDRTGLWRPQGDAADIGAYEVDQGFVPDGVTATLECPGGVGDVDLLSAAIHSANVTPGLNRIELAPDCLYVIEESLFTLKHGDFILPLGLRPIKDNLIIEGNGAEIRRGDEAGDLTLLGLTDAPLQLRDLTLAKGHGLTFNEELDHRLGMSPSEEAFGAGGIYSLQNSTDLRLQLSDVSIVDSQGSGLATFGGDLIIEDSEFRGNEFPGGSGGGLAAMEAQVDIQRSAFVNNTAGIGGAMFVADTHYPTFISRNQLSGNRAEIANAFVLGTLGQATVVNNLLSDSATANTDTVLAFAVNETANAFLRDNRRLAAAEANINFWHNTIVAGETVSAVAFAVDGQIHIASNIVTGHITAIDANQSAVVNAANNIFSGSENSPLTSGNGNLDVDPQFLNPLDGDFRLKAGSPAEDSGLDVGVTEDIDGNARPQGEGVDRGAYERLPGEGPPPEGTPTPTPTPPPGEPQHALFIPFVNR